MFMFNPVNHERHFEPYPRNNIPREKQPLIRAHLQRIQRSEPVSIQFPGDDGGPYEMYFFAVVSSCFD